MVQQSSSAASEARHPTPWCSARWAPCRHLWHVPGYLMEKTYHILLRLPRLSWGTVVGTFCWHGTNTRFCSDGGGDVAAMLTTWSNLRHGQKQWQWMFATGG